MGYILMILLIDEYIRILPDMDALIVSALVVGGFPLIVVAVKLTDHYHHHDYYHHRCFRGIVLVP